MSAKYRDKIEYSIIETSDKEMEWIYSNQEFQIILNDLCQGKILKRIFASLEGVLESLNFDTNCFDFSYMGASVLIIFDSSAVEICIHGEGMVAYRILNLYDIKIIRETKDYPPNDFRDDIYYYDLSNNFDPQITDRIVEKVTVEGTDSFPFSLHGFDEDKAMLAELEGCLPNNIIFSMDNNTELGLYSDVIEYFFVSLKSK